MLIYLRVVPLQPDPPSPPAGVKECQGHGIGDTLPYHYLVELLPNQPFSDAKRQDFSEPHQTPSRQVSLLCTEYIFTSQPFYISTSCRYPPPPLLSLSYSVALPSRGYGGRQPIKYTYPVFFCSVRKLQCD